MGCGQNWIRQTEPGLPDRAAANLAAFTSASARSLLRLAAIAIEQVDPGHANRESGFSAVRTKEHDA
jgi:hypothetical protein